MPILLFILFFQATCWAQTQPNPIESYETLKETIRAKDIKSVDDLIDLIPKNILDQSLYVYDSKSLKRDIITPQNPRIIISNRNASVILAITKKPSDIDIAKGADTVEVINFRTESSLFEFRNLVFNGKETPFSKGEPTLNPQICLRCHGTSPRPIFQNYNAWPGFYGSIECQGRIAKGTLEHQYITSFIATQDKLPRYQKFKLEVYGKETLSLASGQGAPICSFGRKIELLNDLRFGKKMANHLQIKEFIPFLNYVGVGDKFCGKTIPYRYEEVYDAVFDSPARLAQAEKILFRLKEQFKKDQEFKKLGVNKFNEINSITSDRGLFAGPYDSVVAGMLPDSREYTKQMVLLEIFYQNIGIRKEDISLFPVHTSLGMEYGGRLYEIEDSLDYMSKLLYPLFTTSSIVKKLRPELAPPADVNCEALKKQAVQYFKSLPLPDPSGPGILYN